MRVNLVSDLHLEFGPQTLPGGEVLILAGDICEYRALKNNEMVELFFTAQCSKYDRVFMVMGNHEHYHHKFHKTYDDLKATLPANVTLLENEMVEYNGVVFLGATLWSDLNKGDPVTAFTLKGFMNDYKVIQNYYPERGLYYKLTPEWTAETHEKTKQYFKIVLDQNKDKPVVVVTHHAPSFASVNEKFKNDTTINGGYASELSEFILDNPQIKVWCHGHMHDPVDYMIGDTRVLANPRGYLPYEADNGFDVNLTFEV
jgi:Icc-related predicted phosphoesterase